LEETREIAMHFEELLTCRRSVRNYRDKKVPADLILEMIHESTLAASYFMMAAASRGLGTCWVSLGRFLEDPDLLGTIGVPDGCEIIAPVALGYPVRQPPTPARQPPVVLKILQ